MATVTCTSAAMALAWSSVWQKTSQNGKSSSITWNIPWSSASILDWKTSSLSRINPLKLVILFFCIVWAKKIFDALCRQEFRWKFDNVGSVLQKTPKSLYYFDSWITCIIHFSIHIFGLNVPYFIKDLTWNNFLHIFRIYRTLHPYHQHIFSQLSKHFCSKLRVCMTMNNTHYTTTVLFLCLDLFYL